MKTLYDAANAVGMLRGALEQDSISTMEFWATGTMNAVGHLIEAVLDKRPQ